MTTINDVIIYLEELVPLSYQEPYDNCGLLIGNRSMEVTNILVTVDCTEEVLDEAVKNNCNLIITHHPLIFSGLKKITGSNYTERTVLKAIKSDIAVYAIHTNLDNDFANGVNRKIGEKIGLQNTRILAPVTGILCKLITFVPESHRITLQTALFEAGAGHIGNYDHCSFSSTGIGTFRGNESSNPFVGNPGEIHNETEAKVEMIFPLHLQSAIIRKLVSVHPYEEPAYDILQVNNANKMVGAGLIGELQAEVSESAFLNHLKTNMNLQNIRYTPFQGKIKKVAVCGGSGSFLLQHAIKAEADALVSADFKYHQFFDAENRLLIADIGHYESEFFTKELLKELILKKFTTFAVLLSGINTNPIKYY